MLAKFGFTSPFSKRKNKDLSTNAATQSLQQTLNKKSSLLLPTVFVNHEATSAYATHQSNSLNDQQLSTKNFVSSSESSSSGICTSVTNTNSSIHSSHLSSRSQSPSETTDLFNVCIMSQLNNNNNNQASLIAKRKSSLPKISKLIQPTTFVNTSVSNGSCMNASVYNNHLNNNNSSASSKLIQPNSFKQQSIPQPTQIKKPLSTTQQPLQQQQQQQIIQQTNNNSRINMPLSSGIPSTSTIQQPTPKTTTSTSTLNVKKSNTNSTIITNKQQTGQQQNSLNSLNQSSTLKSSIQQPQSTPSKIPSSFLKQKTDKIAQVVLTDSSKLVAQQQQQQQQQHKVLTPPIDLSKMKSSKIDKITMPSKIQATQKSTSQLSFSPKLHKPSLFSRHTSAQTSKQQQQQQVSPAKSELEIESGYVTPNNEKSIKNEAFIKHTTNDTIVEKQQSTAPPNTKTFANLNTINENPSSSGPSSPVKSAYQPMKPMITFSGSNTLDRKLKPLPNTQFDADTFKIFSNSLERKKQKQQELELGKSIMISATSSNTNCISPTRQGAMTTFVKNRLSQDIILENPNVLFDNLSNDNLSLADKEKSIEAIECIEKSMQNQRRNETLISERLMFKEKECKHLKGELEKAHACVITLKNHLDTNAQVVHTLEQTISNLTLKVHTLSVNLQNKDKISNELKACLDLLAAKYPKIFEIEKIQIPHAVQQQQPLVRHNSTESMSSINSLFSHQSLQIASSEHDTANGLFAKKKRNWFRSSFSKAFARKPSTHSMQVHTNYKKLSLDNSSDGNESIVTHTNKRYSDVSDHSKIIFNHSLPNSPMHQIYTRFDDFHDYEQIQRQLRDKESKLTDVRLEALASAHQLDQLKEELNRMNGEMNALREENTKLKAMISMDRNNKSITTMIDSKSGPLYDGIPSPTNSSSDSNDSLYSKPLLRCVLSSEEKEAKGKKVLVYVYVGPKSELSAMTQDSSNKIFIGSISVTTRSKWDVIESLVKQSFLDYLNRIDPNNLLGLSSDSIENYYVGDMQRKLNETQNPLLLPYGYLVGDHIDVIIKLLDSSQNSLDSMALQILIPKSTLQKYISLINEHKNLIFCGHSRTGKTRVARKIGEFMAKNVEFIDLRQKTFQEMRRILFEGTRKVLILDNLDAIQNTNEIFDEFFSTTHNLIIIGTINNPNITTFSLHSSLKWVLFVNQVEPVKSYLKRYAEKQSIAYESKVRDSTHESNNLFKWIPDLWSKINRYIEAYNSTDLTLGPTMFEHLIHDPNESKLEFIYLWNNHLAPYMQETIREGIQAYGGFKQSQDNWYNPKQWILDTSPFVFSDSERNSLVSIDINYLDNLLFVTELEPLSDDTEQQQQQQPNDNLINMLMRLQQVTLGNTQQNEQNINYDNKTSTFTVKHSNSNNITKSIESIL